MKYRKFKKYLGENFEQINQSCKFLYLESITFEGSPKEKKQYLELLIENFVDTAYHKLCEQDEIENNSSTKIVKEEIKEFVLSTIRRNRHKWH